MSKLNNGKDTITGSEANDQAVDESQQQLDLDEQAEQSKDETVTGEAGDDSVEGGDAEDAVVVTIGEEPPTPEDEEARKAPQWVKDLRKNARDMQRKLREKDEEIAKLKGGATETKPVQLGPKPTLEGCAFDDAKYEQELAAWYERKQQVEAQAAQERRAQDEQTKAWEAKLNTYSEQKGKLKVQDFDDAEGIAQEKLSVMQQGIIISGAKNPALVIYALGKNPKKLHELAAITDPVKFAFAAAELEGQLKVSNRKPTNPPEGGRVSGSRSTAGAVDSQLERLRAEAEKTGDYSKVAAYRRQQREKAK